MAQHTSRQRTHLFRCRAYLDAMKSQGIENKITQRAVDPTASAVPRKPDLADGSTEKRRAIHKIADFPTAVRIQALALAEASISYDRIREITGMGAKLLDRLRKMARDQGYDPTTSMQIKEEYVIEPAEKVPGKSRKQRDGGPLQKARGGVPATGVIPGYGPSDVVSLPPGDWNLMAATPVHSGVSLG